MDKKRPNILKIDDIRKFFLRGIYFKTVICFQPLTQQSVTKRTMSALRNGQCPRYETGDARVTESTYDVFRLSFFPGCRRISSLAFRGICAKPHIYVKKNLPSFSRQKFLKKEPDRGLI